MMQRGVPTAQIVSTASGSGQVDSVSLRGGETRLAGFWRQVRHQRTTSKSNLQ